ncbi:MAG: 3-hydroxyacyl-CoA dehydrogenase NAD-binding domain-containing protein [Gammaproteobacteria bacterium]
MGLEPGFKHWRLEIDASNIANLHLDKRGPGPNVLSSEVLGELDVILGAISESVPRGLIIRSAKPSGFIAGADVKEIASLRDSGEALALIRRGQTIFDRLEGLACPTVAAIRGFCVGGGLELALACRYRVALDEPATRLGLPEVLLGIHPGFGGTMRLPRLIGAPAAMDLMLSGRTVDARIAKKLGIVDAAVPERHFESAIIAHALTPPPIKRPKYFLQLANTKLLRPWLARYLRAQVRRRVRANHYPAPYALIDLWERHAGDPAHMLLEEARSVARLATGPSARNLVRVFFLQERLKGLGRKQGQAPPKIHVIGAGVMGGDIAAWCALRGLHVTLQDRGAQYIAPALRRAHDLFAKRIRDRRLRRDACDRLVPDHDGLGLPHADVVIEAIVEDVKLKQALYETIEPRLKADAILATNTSSIPLETLAAILKRPERLVGLHFFNPVAKMQLIEVIDAPATDPECLAKTAALVRALDRLPLPVKSSPGFLVNRVLMPYLMEAIVLWSEGIPPEIVDHAATEFGMPMGPLELADTVGIDICLSVGQILAGHFKSEVPGQLRKLVSQGHLGRKSGKGIYAYRKGKPVRRRSHGKDSYDLDEIRDRLMLRLINEAVACLREGVVEDADLLDAGMIFGTGFAPFRGGPLHYVKDAGKEAIEGRLEALTTRFGPRFTPDPGWTTLAL